MDSPESAVKEPLEIDESPEDKRERSTIEFPYLDLDAAVEVAQGVHQVAGSSCGWDQLAAQMGQTAKGGGFRLRVMTAKTFGFVTYGQGTVTLTDLGQRLNDPQQEKAAKADGFLRVPLYNKIYEQFKNGTLPPADALENEIVKMGVAPKQKGKARQAFQRSANSAGYFWSGPNRLVRPAIKSSAAAAPVTNQGRFTARPIWWRSREAGAMFMRIRRTRNRPYAYGGIRRWSRPNCGNKEWRAESRLTIRSGSATRMCEPGVDGSMCLGSRRCRCLSRWRRVRARSYEVS